MAVSNDLNRKQYTIDSAPTTATTYAFDGRISALTDVYVQETTLTPALSGVTFDQSTDKFEKTAHGLVNGNVLQFDTTAITGFVAGTDYYVINKTDNTFELSLSITGDKVTVDGSSTVSVTTLVRSGATPLVVDLVAGADEDYVITPTTDEISGLITSFSISPTQGALDNGKFAVGSTITIYRQTDFKQDSDYRPNAILPANTLENNLDKLTMMAQQLKDDISRSIRFAESVTDPSNLSIAFDAAQRAGKILSFDSAGEFSISQEIGVWRSAWQNGRRYAARDLVFDDDETSDNRYSIYIAKASHTSDSVSAPLASGDGENWDKVLDASFFATKAGTAEGSATLAEAWASKTDGIVDSTDYSAKAYAIGGTGVTGAAGPAKDWATKTGGTVDASEYSAKEYAIGAAVTTGSSKAWANTAEDTQVTTGLYSSLHYNAKAQAAKTGAETAQAAAVTAQGLAETAQGLAETAQGLAETAQAAAELVYDNFDDRYLGSKTSAPSVDNDGNALLVGALYFDSTAGALRVWDGSAWNSVEALPQPLATTDSPTFAGITATTADINGGTIDGADITGGTVNNATIGGTTPAVGSFTQVNAGNGAEATPSITPTSDPNTGVYFPAADTVGVSTGGSERMRIDSSGNVRADKFTDLAGTGAPDFPNGWKSEGLDAYACRAWVNFRGTTQSGTATASGLVSGQYTATVTSASQFTVVYSGTTYTINTSGNHEIGDGEGVDLTVSGTTVTIDTQIRASGNVSSITDTGIGNYTINFTTAMPNANYCGVASAGFRDNVAGRDTTINGAPVRTAPTTSAFEVRSSASTGADGDAAYINVAIFC